MRAVVTLMLLAAVAGCQLLPAAGDGVPAKLVTSNSVLQQQIQHFVDDTLGGAVLIADNAFTQQSELLIEFMPRRSVDGTLLEGRHQHLAERFVLTKVGERCMLSHSGSAKYLWLAAAQCQSVQP